MVGGMETFDSTVLSFPDLLPPILTSASARLQILLNIQIFVCCNPCLFKTNQPSSTRPSNSFVFHSQPQLSLMHFATLYRPE